MFPHAIIYEANKSGASGSVSLHATFKIKLLFAVMQTSGVFVIGVVLLTAIYSFIPIVSAEVEYSKNQIIASEDAAQTKQVVETLSREPEHDFTEADKTYSIQQAAASLDVNSQFSVVVPKINAKSNIVDNVDASNKKVYSEALTRGVAHAQGTYFPGQGKLIYLFSHSTNAAWNVNRYSAIFYLLNKMQVDDKIIIFYADKQYEYKVTQTVVVGPKDTSWLDASNPKLDGETLILQTCTPAGTNLKRLLVIAKPI